MRKATIITGAGSGIGAATAVEFSRQGSAVFLLGRNREKLAKTAALCANSEIVVCDVASPEQVSEASQRIFSDPKYTVDTLINNAGIFSRNSFEKTTDEEWLLQLNTNLLGVVRLTREVYKHFMKLGRGSIVNVSSTLGLRPVASTSVYSATKAALVNFTQTLALEGAKNGIRVNCVCPGIVDTPIHDFFTSADRAQTLQQLGPLQPLGRIGTPDEIAKSIYFLASEQSAWTTGATLSVDGGINLA